MGTASPPISRKSPNVRSEANSFKRDKPFIIPIQQENLRFPNPILPKKDKISSRVQSNTSQIPKTICKVEKKKKKKEAQKDITTE
jgi:hypothetical protein